MAFNNSCQAQLDFFPFHALHAFHAHWGVCLVHRAHPSPSEPSLTPSSDKRPRTTSFWSQPSSRIMLIMLTRRWTDSGSPSRRILIHTCKAYPESSPKASYLSINTRKHSTSLRYTLVISGLPAQGPSLQSIRSQSPRMFFMPSRFNQMHSPPPGRLRAALWRSPHTPLLLSQTSSVIWLLFV